MASAAVPSLYQPSVSSQFKDFGKRQKDDGFKGLQYLEESILGVSASTIALKADIQKIGSARDAVLILGETGTGKELVARSIHEVSGRTGDFLAVNCSAIPHELFESEMFGSLKGSYTGSITNKVGLFEAAQKGTVFLDEIDSLPYAQQAKLLRVLQHKTIRKVGSQYDTAVDVRVISASNSNLAGKVETGQFRQDLYYRLDVLRLQIAPLRRRPEDITYLAKHFCSLFSESARKANVLSDSALRVIQKYDWPGNVRELENVIKRSVIMADNRLLEARDILIGQGFTVSENAVTSANIELPIFGITFAQLEMQALMEVMSMHQGDLRCVAKYFGLTLAALQDKIKSIENNYGGILPATGELI